jgi:hypothetical protein
VTIQVEGKGKTLRTHRASYELHVGPIPEPLELDHTCNNKACFNPEHLELVTHAENMRRIRRDECANGHALTEDNIYVHGNKRYCRSCRRERNRSRIAKESGHRQAGRGEV